MSEPTLEDAKELIERLKAFRQECGECARISYDTLFRVQSGCPGQLPGLSELLHEATKGYLEREGWEQIPHARSFIKRCEKCANSRAYPWADRLDTEKVLAFMVANKDRGPFFLDELEKTL